MPYVTVVIISPAISTPRAIIGNAFLGGISKSDAISAPVQPPVPGSGIATNSKSPHCLPRFILSRFFSAFASKCFIILSKPFIFLSHSYIYMMNKRINGIGTRFPRYEMMNA